jgi:hypothetical protein
MEPQNNPYLENIKIFKRGNLILKSYTLGDGIIHSHCCKNLKSNSLAKLNILNIKAENIYAREVSK